MMENINDEDLRRLRSMAISEKVKNDWEKFGNSVACKNEIVVMAFGKGCIESIVTELLDFRARVHSIPVLQRRT